MKYQCKRIEGYPEYEIDTNGNVFSYKTGYRKRLSAWVDSKGRYLMVRLISVDGKQKKFLLHRLVALTFIPNPKNLPEINHKDNNPQNPKADNLEWCTRKDNLKQSYLTKSPVRNANNCSVYKSGCLIGCFESITDAEKYCVQQYGASQSSLSKYLQYGDITIIPANQNRLKKADDKIHRTQNRNTIVLDGNGIHIETKSATELSKRLFELTGETIKPRSLNSAYHRNNVVLKKYTISRLKK